MMIGGFMKGSAAVEGILLLVATIIVLYAFGYLGPLITIGSRVVEGVATGTPLTNVSMPVTTTTIPQVGTSNQNASLVNYALGLINHDRGANGLPPVTLASEGSGPQHSDSMLAYGYLSHWDPYGMKPYMRYTLLGGKAAVEENVAYQSSAVCFGLRCMGNINDTRAVQQMEYSMMYNDSACCENGHRDNILDPNHNEVSIGIAYNRSNIYMTQDFIDDYITWTNAPAYDNGEFTMNGTAASGYMLSSVVVSYDSQVSNMTVQQLEGSGSYGYGQEIAGVVKSNYYYYQNITSVTADIYSTSRNRFTVAFNMRNLTRQNGAGVYTVMVWLSSDTTPGFIAGTYSVFIDQNGNEYFPSNV